MKIGDDDAWFVWIAERGCVGYDIGRQDLPAGYTWVRVYPGGAAEQFHYTDLQPIERAASYGDYCDFFTVNGEVERRTFYCNPAWEWLRYPPTV